jgi:hypothetical protein
MSRMRLVKNPSSQFFDNGRHVTLEKRKLRPLRSHNANSCELLNLRSPRFKRASISERIVFFNGGHWLPHGVWIAAKRRCSSRRLGSSVLAHAGGHHAKPLHPRATNVLYLMYLGTCLVERTWRFALPLVLAFVEGKLLLLKKNPGHHPRHDHSTGHYRTIMERTRNEQPIC